MMYNLQLLILGRICQISFQPTQIDMFDHHNSIFASTTNYHDLQVMNEYQEMFLF